MSGLIYVAIACDGESPTAIIAYRSKEEAFSREPVKDEFGNREWRQTDNGQWARGVVTISACVLTGGAPTTSEKETKR